MTVRENALEILRFGTPERVVGGLPCHGLAYFGMNHESPDGAGGHHLPVGSRWVDIWGTTWAKEHEGVMGFPRGNPLADVASLRAYRWPDPDDERLCAPIHEGRQGWNRSEAFLSGGHRDTLWEKSYMLCGMETMMAWFLTEPEAAREVLGRIMDFQLGIARHYLEAGVEVVHCGDDLGTQSGLLLSPDVIDEFLMPEYRRLLGLYRERGVTICFHSCGHVTPLLERLMDLGIACLNPVQASANDLGEMRRLTRGRMALQGGVSSGLIVSGPTSAIRQEVARCLWLLGREGGYFCGPDQGMPWPEEHLRAVEDAVLEFGEYPLREPEG